MGQGKVSKGGVIRAQEVLYGPREVFIWAQEGGVSLLVGPRRCYEALYGPREVLYGPREVLYMGVSPSPAE